MIGEKLMESEESNEMKTRLSDKILKENNKIAGLLFFILAAQFIAAMMLSAAIVTGYDFKNSAISDLGVYTSTALLFNTSVVVLGLFNILGGYFYYKTHQKKWLFVIFALAGIGAVLTGLFPLNTGDIHSLAALVAFLFFNIEVFGSGILLHGPMKVIAFLLGIVGTIFVIIMIIGDSGNTAVFGIIGHGGTERMIVYPALLWLMLLGGYLIGDGS
jgi:hypothetical membrane protein